MLPSLGVPLVGDADQKSFQLQGTFHGAFEFDADVRVGVVLGTVANSVSRALGQHVSIGAAALKLVADAAVPMLEAMLGTEVFLRFV
jgi:hypothetical protein